LLSDDLKKQIQTCYSTILENKQVKPRVGQRLMIADIARVLGNIDTKTEAEQANNPNIVILEAGTGTGKTLAYCLATIPIAKSLKKKVIISPATIALQEQIINKDLPELLNLSPLEFNFTLAKGRRRYICLSQLNKFLSHSSEKDNNQLSLGLAELPGAKPDNKSTAVKIDLELYKKFHKQLLNKKWNGERDDWPDTIEHNSWFSVTTDFHQCTGRNCSEYDACIFYKARERVFKSDCIVANHDLVLSDLAMGGGVVLPAPAESIYVFDEGHHLPDKAISHFSYSFQLNSSKTWLVQLSDLLKSFLNEKSLPVSIKSQITELPALASESSDYIAALMDLLVNNIHFSAARSFNQQDSNQPAIHRFENGLFPAEFHSPILALKQIYSRIGNILDYISDFCSEILDENRNEIKIDTAEYWMQQLHPAISRIESSIALFTHYLIIDDTSKKAPYARWIYQHTNEEPKQGPQTDLVLHCCPVLPSAELQSLLWETCYGAVITSATLSSCGNFNLFKLNSGVEGYFNSIPSHFNYTDNVKFDIPSMSTDPSISSSDHTDEVAEYLKHNLNTSQASLVLFSSKKQLNDIEYFLLKDHKKWQNLILTQGKSNKQEIIRQHKKNIDKDKGSIIFGLASFAEGIDLPGKYCTHVIIAKLPFSVPDNPVDETLSEWMRSQGRNHFFEVSVPQTSIKLVQACGRLIRQESDSGRITLLDRRVLTKRYGRDMLSALPPYTMIY